MTFPAVFFEVILASNVRTFFRGKMILSQPHLYLIHTKQKLKLSRMSYVLDLRVNLKKWRGSE